MLILSSRSANNINFDVLENLIFAVSVRSGPVTKNLSNTNTTITMMVTQG